MKHEDRLAELLTRGSGLDATAARVQSGHDIGLPTREIEDLVADYQEWYGECLAVLPEEVHERFRAEYDGSLVLAEDQGLSSGSD